MFTSLVSSADLYKARGVFAGISSMLMKLEEASHPHSTLASPAPHGRICIGLSEF